MPKILQITQLGDPILREKTLYVRRKSMDPEIQELVVDMMLTCETANGVGIAAPQVSRTERIFIMASKPSVRYPNAPTMEITSLINPSIAKSSPEMEDDWEGCLSIPGMRGLVPRHRSVEVSYTDHFGRLHINHVFEGFLARIFQHEMDHLNGIVFLDRTDSRNLATEREYLRIIGQKA